MSKKLVHWLPRVLAILFALFISMFALDAFGGGVPFTEAIVDFLFHLLPTYIVIAILLIAWKWEWAGGVLFILAGIFYIYVANNVLWSAYAVIAGPPILIGILFIAAHFSSKSTRRK